MKTGAINLCQPLNLASPFARGMVGFWLPISAYARGSRLIDLSGKRIHGTLTSGPTWVSGPSGFGAVKYDGTDDHVTVDLPASHDGPFAVATWLRGAASQSFKIPFGSQHSLTWYTQTSGANDLVCTLYTYPPDGSVSDVTLTGVMDAAWHRVALVFTGSSWRGYHDGVLVGSVTPAGTTVGYNSTVPFTQFQMGRGTGSNYCDCSLSGTGLWLSSGLFQSAPDTWASVDYRESLRGFPTLLNRIPYRGVTYAAAVAPVWFDGLISQPIPQQRTAMVPSF